MVNALAERYPQLDRQVLEHLALTYGPASSTVLATVEEDPEMGMAVVPGLPYIRAEVPYAIRHEMTMTLSDWLIRRTHIMHEAKDQGLGCASEVAAIMALHLGWDVAGVERQVQEYGEQVRLSQRYREGMPGRVPLESEQPSATEESK
jgi:glycerol-3-phosphate dehydrogenase